VARSGGRNRRRYLYSPTPATAAAGHRAAAPPAVPLGAGTTHGGIGVSEKILRIGNASGYWGDDLTVLRRQIEGGPIDVVTLDFLAEITMSILQK
jgi:hypothetical protein